MYLLSLVIITKNNGFHVKKLKTKNVPTISGLFLENRGNMRVKMIFFLNITVYK
jgi:hypothetical protein